MQRPIRAVLFLTVSALAMTACSAGGDTDGLAKEVGDVRAELQRVHKENEKLAAQVAAQARRLDGLNEDVNHVRSLAMEVKVAPVAKSGGVAAASADGSVAGGAGETAPGEAVIATPEIAAIKAFLGTEDGRKTIESAIQAERDARNREQQKRTVDAMVDRFAKTANLTEDQTRRMKAIMDTAATARADMWSSMRELGPDAGPEQRDEARQAAMAKTEELRKQTDEQVKAVLDQAQFEQYQQQQDKLRAGMRGFGGGGGGGGAGGAGGGRGGRQNGN